jgi:hypothetical protein
MIKVKNSQLNPDTIQALNTLIELDIEAGAAFRLTRIIKEISSIIDDKNKMEKRILDKWVQRDENGTPTRPLDPNGNPIEGAVNLTNPESFNQEMASLMDVENEIDYPKIKFEELSLKTAKVKDLIKLEFLFD